MALRAVVEERDYAVAAKIPSIDENGEEVPRSDRIAAAMRVSWEVTRLSGRPAEVVDDGEEVAAILTIGDATEEEFEETAATFLEAASW